MTAFYILFCIISLNRIEQFAFAMISSQDFESPCIANSRLVAPILREEKANSILECSFLCADTTGIPGPDEHCYGFNFCDTTHSCELLIGNQTSITSTHCHDLTTNSNCRFFKKVSQVNQTQNENIEKYERANGTYSKVFQSTAGQSSDISILRNSIENGHEIRIRLNEWKSNKYIYLRADSTVIYNSTDKVCAQSIWNFDWDDVSRKVTQTFYIICSDTGVSVQEWILGPVSYHDLSLAQQQETTWFASGRTKRLIDHKNDTELHSSFYSGFEMSILFQEPHIDYMYVVAFPFSSMSIHTIDNRTAIASQFPWSVSVEKFSEQYNFDSPLDWYSRFFHTFDYYLVNEWFISTREEESTIDTHLNFSEWKVDEGWRFVYENEGEIHRSGNISDLILYVNQGCRVRIVDSYYQSSEVVSLFAGDNEVWGLTDPIFIMVVKSPKAAMAVHYSHRVSQKYYISLDNITNGAYHQEQQTVVKWFVDTSDWNKVYTTEDFRLGNISLEVAFNGAIEYGAPVRVQIPYNLTQLFMTVDNMVYDVVEKTLVATAVRHVHWKVEEHHGTFIPTAMSEFFRIHTNGTIFISRFTYVAKEFVDSETNHDVSINWFVNF